MNNIHIHKDGIQLGPYSEEQIREGISQGQFHSGDLAWKEGLADWQPISTILDIGLPPSQAATGLFPQHTSRTFPATLVTQHAAGSCPLCGSCKHMPKAESLYGHVVCKKCYYGFANRRQLAYLLGIAALNLAFFIALIVFGILVSASGASGQLVDAAFPLLFLLVIGLWLCKDGFSGQSIGKAICGVKVIDSKTGKPADMGASLKRNLPLLIPVMPLVAAFQLNKGQRIGDGWAKTKVILKKHATNPVFALDASNHTLNKF